MKEIKTIGKLLLDKVDNKPENNAIGWIVNDSIYYNTFKEYYKIIETLALALNHLGLGIQDKLTILSHTRKEWNFFDHATLSNRAILVPIYPNYLSKEIKYIINHSESHTIVVENIEQLDKIINIQDEISTIKNIISIETIPESTQMKIKNIKFYNYQDLMNQGKDLLVKNENVIRKLIETQDNKDIASIIYTSGTTGEPKGAVITQYAFASMLMNLCSTLKHAFTEKDNTLIFLPTSHVLGRCDSMLNLAFGLHGVYAESIDKLVDNMGIVRPTVLLAVPRIFEKIYEKVNTKIDEGSPITKTLFKWAEKVSTKYFDLSENGQRPSFFLKFQRSLAYKLVFSKIYERFGGKIRFFVSGGAPISKEIIKFLRNANLTIMEGYGLTETIAPCVINPADKQIPGSVGQPLHGVELKFASDGEILIKTDAMLCEYYKNPQATEAALKDGWLYTGDIGKLNSDNFLMITDRKKDIIVTSGGKNVAPQPIENKMKLKKHIAHFLVVGDKRKYLTGIVGIDQETFQNLFPKTSVKDLSSNAEVQKLIRDEIESVNCNLARFETIKNFYIAPEEFSIENGTLTPSLKLKKKAICEKFKNEIEHLYNAQ